MQAEVDVVARTGVAHGLDAFIAPRVQAIRPSVSVEVNVVQGVGCSPCQGVLKASATRVIPDAIAQVHDGADPSLHPEPFLWSKPIP
jgi:hypothetical protein